MFRNGAGVPLSLVVGLVLTGAATLGCSDSKSEGAGDTAFSKVLLQRDTAAATQTDSLTYHLIERDGRYEGRAMVTFRNTSPDTAYFVNCNGATAVQLERQIDSTWVDAWNSEQNQCLSAPIVVPPGDSLRRPVLLFDGYHPDTTIAPVSPIDESPVYRLVWTALVHHYRARLPFGSEPPLQQRISNRFVLVGAPR